MKAFDDLRADREAFAEAFHQLDVRFRVSMLRHSIGTNRLQQVGYGCRCSDR